ncbi:phosphoglucosamine mutase [Haloferax sp. AB510]|uniref:phosphoglucosamine mutase n=1 Tax=Haloferax sp. AB510 TaxID=2934172 RepID=UPI00209BE08D|nr:phosphoglucosamine mutase [Haloferax sp. AB510]MCO8265060.1 phosphoglucosamine mutase [Haloferax sp. AB510]
MFAPSRIRGSYGTQVTAKLALKAGRALAGMGDEIVVGHDPSDSARLLADAVATGVCECGGTVHRLGPVASPTVSHGVRQLGGDAGVAVTTVSDPAEDTGLKLFDDDGSRLSWERQSRVVRRVNGSSAEVAPWDEIGEERRWDDATAHHLDHLCEGRTSVSDTRVVVDVGERDDDIMAEALERLGCDVERLDGTADDSFPRRRVAAGDDACGTLRRAVAASNADIGLAHDADADRLVAVDETGEVVGGDALLGLFAREAVRDADGDARVAVPLEASRRIGEVVSDAGGSIVRVEMDGIPGSGPAADADVVFGGEPTGVYQWPAESPCPDATLSAIRLARLVDEGDALSEQAGDVAAYPLFFDSFAVDNCAREMTRLATECQERFDDVRTDDGIFVERDDAWFVVRASRTERVLRATVEGTSRDSAKRLFDAVRALVSDEKTTLTA